MKQNIFPSDHSDKTRRRDITKDLKKKVRKNTFSSSQALIPS